MELFVQTTLLNIVHPITYYYYCQYLQEIIIINIPLNDERLFFIIILHSSGQQSSTRKEMSHIIFSCINILIASEGFFVLPPTHPSTGM